MNPGSSVPRATPMVPTSNALLKIVLGGFGVGSFHGATGAKGVVEGGQPALRAIAIHTGWTGLQELEVR